MSAIVKSTRESIKTLIDSAAKKMAFYRQPNLIALILRYLPTVRTAILP